MSICQIFLIANLLFGFQYQFDDTGYEYYRPITDNFLFNPLGWKKPDTSPRYELMATVIGETYKKAYIRDTRNGRDYFVSIGDNIGDDVVLEIHRGLVQLDGEELKEIKGDTFGLLNTTVRKRTETRKGRSSSTSSGTGTKSIETQDNQDDTRVRSRTTRGRVGSGEDWQARMSQFQNASPEERQSMIEQFRQMRGNRGGRDNRRNRRQRD